MTDLFKKTRKLQAFRNLSVKANTDLCSLSVAVNCWLQ